MARNEVVADKVLKVLSAMNEGSVINVDDIAKTTNLGRVQIQNAMNRLIEKGEPMQKVVAGRSWRRMKYDPNRDEKKSQIILNVLTTMKDGSLLVQNVEDKSLYKLMEL